MDPNTLLAIIKNRRSIFPNSYLDKPIERAVIEEILEAANWAPNHRKTEPWRFKVFQGAALERLANYLGAYYQANTPADKFSDMKLKKTLKKPKQSACVIALCMQRDPKESVPEWEEQAALAMAVQNMWLMCTAHGIGSYWSSPKSMIEANEFLGLQEGEQCYGIFYMGYHELEELPASRGAIAEKVEWIVE